MVGCDSGLVPHPDQGEQVFTQELVKQLARLAPVVAYSSSSSFPSLRLVDPHPLISPGLARRLWEARPWAVGYISHLTPASLVRMRALKAAARGAPVVVMPLVSPSLDGARGLLTRLLRPDLVLSSATGTRSRLRELGCPTADLPPAVDLDRFHPPDPGEKARLRAKWSLPAKDQVVLHVGHLVPARNLEALARLAGRPGTTAVLLASHVRVAGSEDLKQELLARGVLVLEGYRPDVAELYRAVDCYVFPCRPGGGIDLPASVLEALASDLPVVTLPFGALPERFPNAAGIRFVKDDGEIGSAVSEMLLRRPGTRALAEAFSWEALARHIVNHLYALAAAGRTKPAPAPLSHTEGEIRVADG